MSFQTYLDNIYKKTGVTADEFKVMAREKGLNKNADIVAWLKSEYDLGTGHARAIADVVLHEEEFRQPEADRVAKHFTGRKSHWQAPYDGLLETLTTVGSDVTVSPAASYLSLLRGRRKFAIVQVGAKHLDIGIKLKDAPPTPRFEPAGTWNSMVTHRVRITEPSQLDAEVRSWLRRAYDAAG